MIAFLGLADSTTTFLILGLAVVFFVSNKVPVAIVALGVSLALWATGVLELDQSLSGFGDPTVLFIAGTFVVAAAVDSTGVTTWIGQKLLEQSGSGRAKLLVLIMVICALITALITPNASVAALIPAVVIVAMRSRQKPSALLMPMAFGAHAGALLALTGSPVNVLVARILAADYELNDQTESGVLFDRDRGAAEVVVPPRSPLVGTEVFPGMVTDSGELVVLAVRRRGDVLGPKPVTIAVGDVLVLRGSWEALATHITPEEVIRCWWSPTLRW